MRHDSEHEAALIESFNRYPLLSREEEHELSLKKDTDKAAKDKLIQSNLRFVARCVHKYTWYGAEFVDLFQEGTTGLIRAVEMFDPNRGLKLITYAVWWINARLSQYVMRDHSIVRIGTTQSQRTCFYKLRSTWSKLDLLTRVDSVKEAAKILKVKESDVEELSIRLMNKDVSLDALIVSEEGNKTYVDLLEDDKPLVEDLLEKLESSAELQHAFNCLDTRHRMIIHRRFVSEESLQVIATDLDLSRERVRQLEAQALKKLKVILGGTYNGSKRSRRSSNRDDGSTDTFN